MEYTCTKCSQSCVKFRTNIRRSKKEWAYIDRNGYRVHGRVCVECRLNMQSVRRRSTKNNATKKYEKTISGFLMRKYRNMTGRVSGIQKQKSHLYGGLEILSKESFYEWASSSEEFKTMFLAYEQAGYDRKLCPTVDRINPKIGYVINNMRWLTHSENSRLGSLSKRDKSRAKMVNDSKTMGPLD